MAKGFVTTDEKDYDETLMVKFKLKGKRPTRTYGEGDKKDVVSFDSHVTANAELIEYKGKGPWECTENGFELLDKAHPGFFVIVADEKKPAK